MRRLNNTSYGQRYRLSSGREFYATRGIIGIGPDCGADELGEGDDGAIVVVRDWDPHFTPWSAEERAELADEMIRRWSVFKGVRPS